jgi:hypothetical protein
MNSFSKRITFLFFYIFIIIFLLEVFSRGYLIISTKAPFFKPSEIIYHYYPELRIFKNEKKDDQRYFDVLFLGASTLNNSFGNIEEVLLDRLNEKMGGKVRIFNLAIRAQSSLDDYYKYRFLRNRKFDLVLFYDGFNEIRANNCPPNIFREDYSHYWWYEDINILEDHPEIDFFSLPYLLHSLSVHIWRKVTHLEYVPIHRPRKDWMKYGGDIKTKESLRRNLNKILGLANEKGDNFLPEGYSFERFKRKTLDYGKYLFAIETWGIPKYVDRCIQAHNDVIKEFIDRPKVIFVDQAILIPKKGIYFNDVCHLTAKGCALFVDNILGIILKHGQLIKG